ncbi:competence protein ComK [Rummeliibacillus stabekisii]|uniref:Competence protein ComK n=1 Tax=Rummeliibacillus stabekisii TaxID=241244 RepID=A0A143HA32_9BACL|nr:competence protein ComK [Rummeliibacillus stabekisii]AMW98181.1 hypothetical protein ATY39_01350 [Rummeliibacillus stabekisii]
MEIIKIHEFYLTPDICMLKPILVDKRNYSLVIELNRQYIVSCTVTRLINYICTSLGTSLDISLEYSNYVFSKVNEHAKSDTIIKLPIILTALLQPYIFFPTASPKKKHNAWILWQNFRGHTIMNKQEMGLYFKKGVYIEEQLSFTTLSRQQYYASILYFRHMDEVINRHRKMDNRSIIERGLFLMT